MAGIKNEQAKVALIFESLAVSEDRSHLKGLTNLSDCQQYLRQKYNRPHKIVGAILNKGTMMQFPGDSQKVSKSNCLTMLEVRRDLKKYAMESKLDSFYLSSIAGKCFTEVEYGRYIRESELDETAFQEDVRKAAALKRKTAIMNSTTVPGDTDKELSEAAKLRDLSDDDER